MTNILIKIGLAIGGFVAGVATCGFIGYKRCPEAMTWMNGKENDEEDAAE